MKKSKNNGTGGLVFANPAILSKYTNDELFALNVVIIGGVLIIIISYYVIPRLAKAYWNYSKKLMDKLISKRKKQTLANKDKYRKLEFVLGQQRLRTLLMKMANYNFHHL